MPNSGGRSTRGAGRRKGRSTRGCRTEALGTEQIHGEAAETRCRVLRACAPTLYMAGVRAKIHEHTRDCRSGLIPGAHTQPASHAVI